MVIRPEPSSSHDEFTSLGRLEIFERSLAFMDGSGASITHDQRDRAFFSPTFDEIKLPPKIKFDSQSKYYATALHELGHWTGHKKR